MRNFIIVFGIVVMPVQAVQISESINCGGAIQTQAFSLPHKLDLRCDQNGFTAIASWNGPGNLQAVAVPTRPGAWVGVVEAAVTSDGVWSLLVDTGSPTTLFWSVCLTATMTRSGTGTAAATLGPGSLGQPCDFAHSVPIMSGVPFVFEEHASVSASSDKIVAVGPTFLFFDENGAPLHIQASVERPPDVPEPGEMPAIVTSLLTGAAMLRKAHRKRA